MEIEEIVKLTCDVLGIQEELVRSKLSRHDVSDARHIAIRLCHFEGHTIQAINKFFNYKHRCSSHQMLNQFYNKVWAQEHFAWKFSKVSKEYLIKTRLW